MRRTGVNNKKRFTLSVGLEKRRFGDCNPQTVNDNMDVFYVGGTYWLMNLDTSEKEELPFGSMLANGWYDSEHDFWKTPFEFVNQDKIEELAKLCSAFNHSFSMQEEVWKYLQEYQRVFSFKAASFRIQNPHAGPKKQHDFWMDEKLAEGWTYGTVKDAIAKTHPNLVPYDKLDPEQMVKDGVFKAICRL